MIMDFIPYISSHISLGIFHIHILPFFFPANTTIPKALTEASMDWRENWNRSGPSFKGKLSFSGGQIFPTRWCPRSSSRVQLVQISTISRLGWWMGVKYRTSYWDYKPTNITGGAPPWTNQSMDIRSFPFRHGMVPPKSSSISRWDFPLPICEPWCWNIYLYIFTLKITQFCRFLYTSTIGRIWVRNLPAIGVSFLGFSAAGCARRWGHQLSAAGAARRRLHSAWVRPARLAGLRG